MMMHAIFKIICDDLEIVFRMSAVKFIIKPVIMIINFFLDIELFLHS